MRVKSSRRMKNGIDDWTQRILPLIGIDQHYKTLFLVCLLPTRTRPYKDFLNLCMYRSFSDVDAGTMEDDKIRKQRFGRKGQPEQILEQRLLGRRLWAQGARACARRVSAVWWCWMTKYRRTDPALGVCY